MKFINLYDLLKSHTYVFEMLDITSYDIADVSNIVRYDKLHSFYIGFISEQI